MPDGSNPEADKQKKLLGRLKIPKVRDFRKRLEQEGFEKLPKRGKGDHEIWEHPDGRMVTLDPGNDPPRVGTFKAMLRQAGIDEREYR